MSALAAVKAESSPSYDEVPYQSFAYPQTQPAHLSTIATLFGLTPPDFRTARVLELGCAGGGNLFPLALLYPQASFLGMDLSHEQIAQANVTKKALNLGNVEFLQQDILNFAPKDKAEKFDYIIAHGVLSWVPPSVQEKLFVLCSEWLSPNGLAVISYNALPGWNAVRSLREMMLYHSNRFTNPAEKVQQSRLLLDFLSESVPESKAGYRAVIEDERAILKGQSDSYMYHDHLEGMNTQFYFHEFAAKARAHGLDYVGDADLVTMHLGNLPPKALEALKAVDDIVSQEQYMDFVNNRRFRTSIVCKSGQAINRGIRSEQIMDYFLTINPLLIASGTDPKQDIEFKAGGGAFTTHDEISGCLFLELIALRQKPIAAKALVALVQKKLGLPDAAPVQAALERYGMSMVLRAFLSLHSDSPPCVAEVSEKPVVFPLARYEAGIPGNFKVTNVLSHTLPSDIVSNLIMQNLDGSKTVRDLAEILVKNVLDGSIRMDKAGTPLKEESEIRKEMDGYLKDILPNFAQRALLVG